MKLQYHFLKKDIPTDSGEVAVILASGTPSIGKVKNKSALIEIDLENEKISGKMGGYCFTDSPVYKVVEQAIEKKEPLLMRFEKVRKDGVDKNIPMSELTKDMETGRKNINRRCAGVYNFNTNEWVLNPESLSTEKDTDDMKAFPKKTLVVEQDTSNFFETQRPATPINFDKQVDITATYFFVSEQLKDLHLEEKQLRFITQKLIAVTDHIQMLILGVKTIDYKSYSRMRARNFVYHYAEVVSPLSEDTLQEITDWQNGCYLWAKDLLKWTATV